MASVASVEPVMVVAWAAVAVAAAKVAAGVAAVVVLAASVARSSAAHSRLQSCCYQCHVDADPTEIQLW